MKSNALFFLFLISSIFNPLNAQLSNKDNLVGTNFLIQSEILNEIREIQVYLPEGYETSDKDYSVLYLLDGQRLFLHGVSLLQSFTHFKTTPELIAGIELSTNGYKLSWSISEYIKSLEKNISKDVENNPKNSSKNK